jgi:Rhs element Vgr protein
MSPASPNLNASSEVTFTIKTDGKALASGVEVVSIDTWNAVNKVPKARLVIFDGNPATGDFELSAAKTFLPGVKVEIAVGYKSQETTIFKGVIVKQGISIDQTQGSKLIVDVTDEAMKMTLERKNALFEKIKDSDLIGKLIAANGLAKSVEATNTVHEQVVQYYATDWDLMMTRAEMNGFVATIEAGKVTVKKPDTSQAPVLTLKYGDSILDLDAEMDAATQVTSSAIKSYTWDPATQKLIESGPGAATVKEQGNVSSAELAKVFNIKKLAQQTGAPIEKSSLQDWSTAELLKSKLSKIRGSVRFQGNSKAVTGKTIELAGLGPRFNGTAFISGVHHHVEDGNWFTTTELGLCFRWFAAETPDITAPEASGQLPAIQGLQTGIVKKIAKDPDGEFRVFVNLPILQDNAKGVWARLGTFYASNKVGALFFPEINDEVIVGFMNDDPRYGVILGGVYSKKLAPPYPPDEQNNQKALVTRSKLEINFNDKDKIIEIKTPGGHSIKMDDKSGAISIKDSNKNTVSLSKGGIALDSASNIKITAKGNITVQANGNLALSAKANATMEGLQVEHKAKTKFAARGNAQAEVAASGILTVRGALVKIN